MMESVRLCVYGDWAYCDGRCWWCHIHRSYTTTSTNQREIRVADVTTTPLIVKAGKDVNVPGKEADT